MCPSYCNCACHRNSIEGEAGEEPGTYLAPPEDCLSGSCKNARCEFCAGHGLGAQQAEAAYYDKDKDEDELEDAWDLLRPEDEEHLDVEEVAGVLYVYPSL